MIELETERLIMFGLSRKQLLTAANEPERLADELAIQISPQVFSDESRQAMAIKISRMEYVEERLHPWYTYFLLVQRSDRQAVGVCGFKGAPSLMGSVEVGYAMHEDYRNLGYMTEGVRALVAWAFQQPDCSRVVAETLRTNLASQKVLQKAGLQMFRAAEKMLYWQIEKEIA